MAKVLDPALMAGFGKTLTLNGETRPCGLQVDPKALKPWTSIAIEGNGPAGSVPIQITKDGAVIEGFDLTHFNILVRANNVVFRNCLMGMTGYWKIEIAAGVQNMTVELCDFFGNRDNGPVGNLQDMTVNAGRGARLIYRQNKHIDLPSDGPNICNGVCEFNFFSGGGWQEKAHADAFSVQGPSTGPIVIRNNYIDFISRATSRRADNDPFIPWAMPRTAKNGTNSSIKVSSHFGPINDVLIENNIMLGGTYVMYIGPSPHPVSGVMVRNNLMGLSEYNPPDDQQGWLFHKDAPEHGSYAWTNNTAYTKAADGVVTIGGTGGQPAPTPVPTPSPAAGAPAFTAKPSILGDPIVGGKVRTGSGTWVAVQPDWKWAWQWKVDGKEIAGATASEITNVFPGKLTVVVAVTAGGKTTTVESDPITVIGTAPIPAPTPVPTPSPSPSVMLTKEESDALLAAARTINEILGG